VHYLRLLTPWTDSRLAATRIDFERDPFQLPPLLPAAPAPAPASMSMSIGDEED
jgi:hypothetical protein